MSMSKLEPEIQTMSIQKEIADCRADRDRVRGDA